MYSARLRVRLHLLVLIGLGLFHGVVPVRSASVEHPRFLWGVCQAYDGPRGDVFPLSRAELRRLRDDLHMNALRLWVHPQWVGIPQRSFSGPEAIDYTRFRESDYVWRDPSPAVDSLDEVLDILRDLGLYPVLMVWPVHEYMLYMPLDDLTSRNDPKLGLDYQVIRPVGQVKALSVALARHVHERYGDRFALIYDEESGGNELGAPRRRSERERWSGVRQAIREVAPGAFVYSPELCIGMWWWGAARPAFEKRGRSVPPVEVTYTETWPPADRLEHFRDAFDGVAFSYFGLNPASVEQKDVAPDRTLLHAATDPVLWTGRMNVRSKRWLWAEAPWGSRPLPLAHERINYRLLLHRDYATLLFGMDHCGGALLWQAKDVHPTTTGEAGILDRAGEVAGTADYPLLKAVSAVVTTNEAFFWAFHRRLNADGFPVADAAFHETDPWVLTRLVGRHLVLFSEAPTLRSVRLTRVGRRRLREVATGAGYSQRWTLRLTPGRDGSLLVQNIRPGVLYLLEVLE